MSPMQFLGRRFGLQFYWADPEDNFTKPGLYVWPGRFIGQRLHVGHVRIVKA